MKEIVMQGGMITSVDDCDYHTASQFKWSACKSGATYYAHAKDGDGKTIKLHHLVFGHPCPGMEIDHVDHNGLNNQRSNLRLTTHRENMQNIRSKCNKSSKYPGVSWHKGKRVWQVFTKKDGKNIGLGCFHDELEAYMAYKNHVA